MKKNSIITFLLGSLFLVGLIGCATNTPPVTSPQVAVVLIKMPNEKVPKRVVLALREDAAPQTAASFKNLINQHYYDGMRFHRVFPNSLVQTGDPKSRHGETERSGTGGPGYTLPAEIHLTHERGAVAASRLSDNINPQRRSNGSQFYVCLEPMPQLNGQYTVFGKVIEGIEVLDKISNLRTNSNSFPIEKIVIVSITMAPKNSNGTFEAQNATKHKKS